MDTLGCAYTQTMGETRWAYTQTVVKSRCAYTQTLLQSRSAYTQTLVGCWCAYKQTSLWKVLCMDCMYLQGRIDFEFDQYIV